MKELKKSGPLANVGGPLVVQPEVNSPEVLLKVVEMLLVLTEALPRRLGDWLAALMLVKLEEPSLIKSKLATWA